MDKGADSYTPQRSSLRARRVGRRALHLVRDGLAERDLAVLQAVAEFRLLTAGQIETLVFTDHATPLAAVRASRRVLERLARDRLLVRLDRRVGGVRAGSSSYVYALGPVGHRILHDDGSRRWREPSGTFVAHTLAVAQLVVDLTVAARAGVTELVEYQCEPAAWRTFSRGLAGPDTLKPDLHVVTADRDDEWSWFVEIDLGTESAGAIARKCRTYHDYWATGTEQHRHGTFPRVLWVVDTERRATIIRKAIARTRTINQDLFAVTTNEHAIAMLAGGQP
jgi:hypothetical protein